MTVPAPIDRRARALEWTVALLWLAAIIVATIQQGVAHQHNNFLIFRAASHHLLAGADLYAAYPAEHLDFFKYSPTFALIFLPLAAMPFTLSVLAWNALNAGALYVALGMVLPRRAVPIARAIVFLDMLGSLQNVQSNALVTALIILSFAAYERRHTVLGTAASIVGAAVKVFPLAALSFALFHPRKLRVALAVVAGTVLLGALPLLVTSPDSLAMQYQSWRAISAVDAMSRGYTVMQMAEHLTRANWPNWPLQLAGVLLLVAPVLAQPSRWREWELRRLYLCSVLVFCVIFNHKAESPTFVVAAAGVGIWFASLESRTRWDWALFAFIVLFTFLASSDAMPETVQREFFDRYHFKTVPLIVLWVELQRRLWTRAPLESRESIV